MNPGYFAILPASVRYDNRLSASEKLMFSEITALAGRDGYAYAKNKYFAELYGVDERTIRRWIAKLADMKYVSVSMVKKGNGADDFRRIVPLLDPDKNVLPPGQKCPEPPDKNVPPIYKEEYIKKNNRVVEFTPPTLQEVQVYCMNRHNNIDPETFINYYEAKGWVIKGDPMKDWRAAVRNWEKRDKERVGKEVKKDEKWLD